ncbi:MFS transporter [Paenibacillus agricola]|uniref:Multidrug efflux MFS transporter n=1 Tax=Paenibacillus agricola TaxID=2716264 RepID=A0ABX0JAQ7_9BACL|nr:MFS transporter [Paenibacillus agricola]NHN30825.1 multidrug efflux MFS transporter [Paenibacillus agricola]
MAFSWKRNLYIMWIGSFFISASYTVSVPFLPIFLHDELGVTNNLELWSGAVFSISFLASALMGPFWGTIADKYGRKSMMVRSGLSFTILYFLTYFVQDPYQLLAVRLLNGLFAGYIPAAIALVATNTPEKHVGYSLGVMSTANAAGNILGPLMGGFLSHWLGNRNTFLVSSGLTLVSLIIAIVWVKETNFNRSSARSKVWGNIKDAAANRDLSTILLLTLITSMSVMILEPLLTIYVLQLGSNISNAAMSSGIIFSAVGVATIIAAPRWGIIGSRIGYGKVLFIGLIGGGLGNLLQIAFHNLVLFGGLRFVYGLFFAAVYPALNSLIVKTTDPSFRGRAFSLNQSMMQAGMMLGPLLGGFLSSQLNIPAVFVINGTALLVIAMVIRRLKLGSKAEKAPEEAKALN